MCRSLLPLVLSVLITVGCSDTPSPQEEDGGSSPSTISPGASAGGFSSGDATSDPGPNGIPAGTDATSSASGDAGDGGAPDAWAGDGVGSDSVEPNQDGTEADSGAPEPCPLGTTPCAADGSCCVENEQCLSFGCSITLGTCIEDAQCQNDSYCFSEGGVCVPYGKGPQGFGADTCTKDVPPGVFFPALQCEWSGPPDGDAFPNHRQVLGSAAVARIVGGEGPGSGGVAGSFSTGGNIVFVSYNGSDGGLASASCCGIIRILDGATCEQLYTLSDHTVVGGSNVAIGDLDLDGKPEIVALAEGGGLVAFTYDADADTFGLMWRSVESDGVTTDTFAQAEYRWAGPSIADLVDDEHPEIVFEGVVYNWEGIKLGSGLGWVGYQQGVFPIIADVELDGEPEVVLGAIVYRFDAAAGGLVMESYASASLVGGHAALADFGAFGATMPPEAAEIALVHSGNVSVRDLTGGIVFGDIPLPGGGTGGPPTVADFDGDGKPEIAAAGAAAYSVFDPDCTGAPLPTECASEGVLWSQPSQDQSSNKTGSSVFDFEGDGKAEAVYGDECFLRVYDGGTGEVLFSGARSSCTWHEMPVIADVDGDYRTEIVIGSNTNCNVSCPTLDPIFPGLRCDENAQCVSGACDSGFCRCSDDSGCLDGYQCAVMLAAWEDGQGMVCRAAHTGKLTGIRVYNDLKDHWVHSRPIWNQHAYSITNVDADGTIPPREEVVANWTQPDMNHFRQNAQGEAAPLAAPDLTIRPAEDGEAFVCQDDGDVLLRVEVCNRGITPVTAGIEVGFYGVQPQPGVTPLCSGHTSEPLPPTVCTLVSCQSSPEALPTGTFWATVDDPIEGDGEYLECIEENNLAKSGGIACP